jgi:hypothetical protein
MRANGSQSEIWAGRTSRDAIRVDMRCVLRSISYGVNPLAGQRRMLAKIGEHMKNALGIGVALAFLASPVHAQVSAKHVEEPPKQLTGERFKSPMVLEFPLAVADRSLWDAGEVRTNDDISKYICDGVSFSDFSSEAKKGRDQEVTITFRFVLYDEPGVDKRVDVAIDVVRGETHLGETGFLKNIKLGEKKHVTKSIDIRTTGTDLEQQPKPTVRLTTVVHDDR